MVVVCVKKVDTLLARKGPAEPQVPLGARWAARAPSPAIPRLRRYIAFDSGLLSKNLAQLGNFREMYVSKNYTLLVVKSVPLEKRG